MFVDARFAMIFNQFLKHLRQTQFICLAASNKTKHRCLLSIVQLRQFCDSDDSSKSSPDEITSLSKTKKMPVGDPEKAKQKLAELLNAMKVDTTVMKTESTLSSVLAKPKHFIRRSARQPVDKKIEEEKIDEISKGLDSRLVKAAKMIADTIGDHQKKAQTESELLKILRQHTEEIKTAKEVVTTSSYNLDEVFSGMKIDAKKPSPSPGQFKRSLAEDTGTKRLPTLPQTRKRPRQVQERVNIFSGESLDIFDKDMKQAEDLPVLRTWDRLMQDEVDLTVTHPPTNPYEEMIQWTKQGKLWKYPIDNEQGLDQEAQVPFYEHVMLDHLLEGFPERGPIRKFMELVTMGLANNPFITVERKHAMVEYYKKYFNSKQDLLKASGAIA